MGTGSSWHHQGVPHAAVRRISSSSRGPAINDTSVTPCVLAVPESTIEDLRTRLSRTRLPETDLVPAGSDPWSRGVPLTELEALREHWLERYDWRRLESELNSLGQWTTTIDGVALHLLHLRSERTDAAPLLLTHGWPGSVVEFLDVARPLADPPPGQPAFHVVAPSLPGFGLSGKPREAGWDVERITRAWAELMTRLGYARFFAQGGDWGAEVTTLLGALHPDRVMAVHTSFPQAQAPDGWQEEDLDAREAEWLHDTRAFWRDGTAYAEQMVSAPQTLGYALDDSPVALLAWVADKFHAWTDPTSEPYGAVQVDRLLDNVMLHWIGVSGASAAQIYAESWGRVDKVSPVDVPAAVSVFPGEIEKIPRAWVEARYRRLVRWEVLDRGGHFPSLEVPDLFVDELRASFAGLASAPD